MKTPAHFTRKTLPKELSNHAEWPSVDLSDQPIDVVQRVTRVKEAITLYLDWAKLEYIHEHCKVNARALLAALNRCVAVAPTGQIWGWAALVPYVRVKEYRRTVALPADQFSGGNSGAFQLFMDEHPKIRQAVERALIAKTTATQVHDFRRTVNYAFEVFLKACREEGISPKAYPLNTKSKGRRSIARLAQVIRTTHWAQGLRANGAKDAAHRLKVATGDEPHHFAHAPFDIVQMDAHRIDVVGTVRIPTPKGKVRVPIRRLVLIVIVDVYSHAILGYAIAIGREAKARDVVAAVNAAVTVWEPRDLKILGLTYPAEGGLPSGVIPEARGAAWAMLQVDNAMVHLSNDLIFGVRGRLGCAVNFGPFGAWERRWLVENTYGRLEARGLQRIVSSTDSDPISRGPVNSNKKAVDHEVDLEELLELIDVLVAGHNGTKDEGLSFKTPLQVLREAVTSQSTCLVRTLPPAGNLQPELGISVEQATVRGDQDEARRPYIQIDRAIYKNHLLARSPGLIGTRLVLHIDERDMRTVRAFLQDGAELGVLKARGGWGRTPHSRDMRRLVNSLMDTGELQVARDADPIVTYHDHLAAKAAADAMAQKASAPKMSDAATQLARTSQETGLPIPTTPPVREPAPRADYKEPNLPIDKFQQWVNKNAKPKGLSK